MELKLTLLVIFVIILDSQAVNKICNQASFKENSIVCECNELYCDSFEPNLPKKGFYLHVTSNKKGLRFHEEYGRIKLSANSGAVYCENVIKKLSAVLILDVSKTYQKIIGFGGSFTDSTGYNIAQLSNRMQEQFMKSYFTSNGLNYNMGRTPIGHTDFSRSIYYYSEKEYDINMEYWKLNYADYNYKIPYIKWAKKMVKNNLYLVSSLWTVPSWMRKLDDVGVLSAVREEYFNSYALYIIKYLEAYKKQGIDVWAVGYANEPLLNSADTITENSDLMFTVWPINKLEKFAIDYLVPYLRDNGFNNTNMLFLDDSLSNAFYNWVQTLKEDKEIKRYLQVLGLHSYTPYVSASIIDEFHEIMPNVLIVTTELCAGQLEGVKLGKWERAEFYTEHYLTELNHYVSGWIDWNMALDTNGNPRILGVPVDAPIIINTAENKFYKQPSYYAIGHFSKFIPEGSVRVQLDEVFPTDVIHAAVLRPDGLISVVLYNPTNYTIDTTIMNGDYEEVRVHLTPNSINTVVFEK